MRASYVFLALLATMAAPRVDAVLGIDISIWTCNNGVSAATWQCLKNNLGANAFAIIQTFNGGLGLTNNIANCVQGAWNAGFAHVDVYAFLCNRCSGNVPSSSAVQRIHDFLRQKGVKYGMLWFDVEQCNGCWDNPANARTFLLEATNHARNLGINYGMYSSMYSWQSTVGTAADWSSRPLWYAHYDNNPSFSDSAFYRFGGWTKPAMKQYIGDTKLCGIDVDLSWYPNSFFSNGTTRGDFFFPPVNINGTLLEKH